MIRKRKHFKKALQILLERKRKEFLFIILYFAKMFQPISWLIISQK